MSQIPADAIPPATSGSVDADIPCRKCAYNLRGLPLDGRCPECGTPVGVSINGELLRYSDPAFVYTLRKGVSLILWGILAEIVMIVLGVVFTAAHVVPPNSALLPLIYFLASTPILMGSWLITTPDPSGIGEDKYGTARKIIRISLAIGILNNLISFIAQTIGPLAPSARMAFETLEFVVAAIGLIGTFAQLAYLKKLAFRIPDLPLSRQADSVMWGFGVSYGLMIAIGFGMKLLAPSLGGGAMVFVCAFGFLGLVVLAYAILYLLMLFRFGRQFEEQAKLARELWSQASA